MRPARLNLSLIVILFLSLHSGHAEESQEEHGKKREVDTLYSADVADMNFNIDSPLLKGEIFPETRKRILTAADIKGWPDAKLQYAINEMYARRNANFGNKNVKKFFLSFDWYTPISEATLDAVEMHFSAIETSNLKLLGEARQTFRSSGTVAAMDDKTRQLAVAIPRSQLSSPPAEPPLVKAAPKPARSGKTFEEVMKENDEWARHGMTASATVGAAPPKPQEQRATVLDGALKQILAPRIEAYTPDSSTSGLNLVTSLSGGPSSSELEQMLQTFIEFDPSIYPAFLANTSKDQSQTNELYAMKMMHNRVTSARITNEYTRIINGETVYVYEIDGKAMISLGDKDNSLSRVYPKLDGYTLKIIKRGKKWYGERAAE